MTNQGFFWLVDRPIRLFIVLHRTMAILSITHDTTYCCFTSVPFSASTASFLLFGQRPRRGRWPMASLRSEISSAILISVPVSSFRQNKFSVIGKFCAPFAICHLSGDQPDWLTVEQIEGTEEARRSTMRPMAINQTDQTDRGNWGSKKINDASHGDQPDWSNR